MRWTGHVSSIGEIINAYRILVVNSGGKKPLGRPWTRLEDNIKIDFLGIYDGMKWNGLIWLRKNTCGGML